MSAPSTEPSQDGWLSPPPDDEEETHEPALVIAWSYAEPARMGEIAFLPARSRPALLGRGLESEGDRAPRLRFIRHRPSGEKPTPPLGGTGLSRAQLLVTSEDDSIVCERVGRCAMLVNSAPVDHAVVRSGDVIFLENELILLCVSRPRSRVARPLVVSPAPFGEADAHGLVGESPAAWALRERIAFLGPREPHVLILGESGTGKEIVARALHTASPRARRPFLSRNAATFPPGLIDAELFGNARNYPNPGLAERPGLLGEAHGTTLFLDEIGEMPPELQAHLLRVLDRGGEYQRLGDSTVRTTDVRLIAATNRSITALKHDFLARLQLTVHVPGLDARREDIPLLTRHLLRRMAAKDPGIAERFFSSPTAAGEPRMSPLLTTELLRHSYTTNVRELESLLWTAIAGSARNFLDLTPEVRSRFSAAAPPSAERTGPLTAEEIQACLARCDGSVSRAYKELGLSSRDALYRLLKKHGLSPKADPGAR